MVAQFYRIPAMPGSTNKKTVAQADPGINVRPYLKNNQCQKLVSDSSGAR
jgi:hypothetical protein